MSFFVPFKYSNSLRIINTICINKFLFFRRYIQQQKITTTTKISNK